MATDTLESRFTGAIVGTAVGDALGAPFEGQPWHTIPPASELIEGYLPMPDYPLGQFTDDTQLTLAVAASIAERRGVDPGDIARRFVALWESGQIIGQGLSCHDAVMRLLNRQADWRTSGTEVGRAGNGCAMRASPVGLWNYDRPDRIVEDARLMSVITHQDPRAQAGAVAVAAAVAYLTAGGQPDTGPFLEAVAAPTRELSPELAGYIMKLPDWIDTKREVTALEQMAACGWKPPTAGYYGITPFVIPTVLVSLYCFLKSPEDFLGSVIKAVTAGGDVDTLAAITGAISGAFNGIEVIPSNLVEGLVDIQGIRETAGLLAAAKMEESGATA